MFGIVNEHLRQDDDSGPPWPDAEEMKYGTIKEVAENILACASELMHNDTINAHQRGLLCVIAEDARYIIEQQSNQ